jgi:hypothetical protein
MKKLIILLFAVIAISVSARVTTQRYTTPANIAAWGTAADTLVASAADTLVMKVTSDYVGKMNLVLFTDAVSGTPAYSAVLSGSVNQVGWTALDTIAHSGGGDKTAYFDLQDLKYNYYRIIITATSAAQKSREYLYGLTRF